MKDQSKLDVFNAAAKSYLDSLLFTVEKEGKANAVKLFKEYLLIAKKISLKEDFTPVPFRKSDKRGVPRVLRPLLQFLTSSPEEIRLALTVCRVVEILHLKPNFDPKVITNPGPVLDQE